MGPFDAFIVYKFIRILSTPWDEQPAFAYGIIDAKGHQLRKQRSLKTQAEKNAYTIFHRLSFNIKRFIEKLPFGKTRLGTFAAAMWLIREQMQTEDGVLILEQSFMSYLKDHDALYPDYLREQYLPEEDLMKGHYKLLNTVLDTHGETVPKGTILVANTDVKPTAHVLGIDVYQLNVQYSKQMVAVSDEDIQRISK